MVPTAHEPGEASSSGKPSPSDGQLVAEVLAGRRASYDVLVGRYQRQAVAVSYRLLGNIHDAMEVSQDAMLKAYRSLGSLQKPEAFGGWLMRIVSNLSLNFRRGRTLRSTLALDECLTEGSSGEDASSEWMAHTTDPAHRLESQEMGQRLQEAMKELPEKQRLALTMFTLENLPQKQIAEALGCSVEAVKWHVFQGRKRLRELLKDYL